MERVDYQAMLVQDFVNLANNKELNLAPWYQRRKVWTKPQQAYLVNTLFEQMPVPSIYIRYDLDVVKEKVIKEVVDGQQRLQSILAFCNDEIAVRHPKHSKRVKFSQLTAAQRKEFLLTQVSVGILVGSSESDVIEIFGRLNSIAKTLNRQEKRNANFSGEMKQFCLKEAANRTKFWRDRNIFSATDISRMAEVEFLSDLVYNMTYGLSDFSQKALDDLYDDHEERFSAANRLRQRLDRVFSALVSLSASDFKDTIFSRKPVFFSLFLILDDIKSIPSAASLRAALIDVDARFRDREGVTDTKTQRFREATVQTSQRIANRRIRDKFIRSAL